MGNRAVGTNVKAALTAGGLVMLVWAASRTWQAFDSQGMVGANQPLRAPGTSAPSSVFPEVARQGPIGSKPAASAPPSAMAGSGDRLSSPQHARDLALAADEALRRQDGPMAAELAALLGRCERMPAMQEHLRQSMQKDSAPDRRQLMQDAMNVLQREQASCQAVGGDARALRERLLEVAVKAGTPGASVELFLAGHRQGAVTEQLIADAALGEHLALRLVANGQVDAASSMQVAAAREAILRGAQQADTPTDLKTMLADDLDFLQRHATVEAWRSDPQSAAKRDAARKAWTAEQGGMHLEPSSDPQVRALADQYLSALKNRHRASQGR